MILVLQKLFFRKKFNKKDIMQTIKLSILALFILNIWLAFGQNLSFMKNEFEIGYMPVRFLPNEGLNKNLRANATYFTYRRLFGSENNLGAVVSAGWYTILFSYLETSLSNNFNFLDNHIRIILSLDHRVSFSNKYGLPYLTHHNIGFSLSPRYQFSNSRKENQNYSHSLGISSDLSYIYRKINGPFNMTDIDNKIKVNFNLVYCISW